MPKVTFTIGKDGMITSDAEGFQGKLCVEKTDAILEGLGVEKSREFKPDYYAEEHVQIFS